MASSPSARPSAGHSPARLPARPPDHLCGLGYSPSDPRQSQAEKAVLTHAERLLNMVHAYCEIRDAWTGWLRGSAMSRTLHERIVPEMRALREAERRVLDKPSVTLLAVLDYAARARKAVPAYTPRATIDHPQPPVSVEVRQACERMRTEAEEAALAAQRASAREYAARMAAAIEREREEEARRQRAMRAHGVSEKPAEAAQAQADLAARIAIYEREIKRVYEQAGLGTDGEAAPAQEAPVAAGPTGTDNRAGGHTVTWRVAARRFGKTFLAPTPETAPAFARRLVLVDRGSRGGALRAFGGAELDGRRETINGIAFRLTRRRSLAARLRSFAARLRRDRDRYEARLTPAEVREMRT